MSGKDYLNTTPKYMDIIDETDEIMQELEGQVKKPHLKEQKIRKHLVKDKDEKYIFDSGEYYKKQDIEKKMVDQAKTETEKQAHLAEEKAHHTGEKKKKHIDMIPKQQVGSGLIPENRIRLGRTFYEDGTSCQCSDYRRTQI